VYKIDSAFRNIGYCQFSNNSPPRGSVRMKIRVRVKTSSRGRLGSRVSLSASFQIFALTAGGNVLGGGGELSGGGMSGENMSYTHVYVCREVNA